MTSKVVGVIPARLDSKRFHGKVLYPYRGKPLLYYLFSEVSKAKTIDRLIIATDSKEVQTAAVSFGAEVMLTSERAKTGSDRVAEVMRRVPGNIFLNIQADNYGLNHVVLDRVISKFREDRTLHFGTLARKIESETELSGPGVVKVVLKENNDAGWFSRHPLPYLQKTKNKTRTEKFDYLYHIGIYLFRKKGLAAFAGWKPTPCEKAESLEQLRILENGENIRVFLTKMKTVSVDTPRDLRNLKEVI